MICGFDINGATPRVDDSTPLFIYKGAKAGTSIAKTVSSSSNQD
jgi:hypothetical protein